MDSSLTIVLHQLTDLIKITGSPKKVAEGLRVDVCTMLRWRRGKHLPRTILRERIDKLHLDLCGVSRDVRRGQRAWRRFRPNRVDGFIDGDGI